MNKKDFEIIDRVHFKNSVFLKPGTLSCAVDCFIEISHVIFAPYLKYVPRTEVFDIIFQTCEQFEILQTEGKLNNSIVYALHEIRKPLWDHLRSKCSSFTVMDADAQFSQIFELNTFNTMNMYETQLFLSSVLFENMCENCNLGCSRKMDNFVTYITNSALLDSKITMDNWFSYIERSISKPNSLNCSTCKNNCESEIVATFIPAKILFIEFSNNTMNTLVFYDQITVTDIEYSLKGIVRCQHSHFTCAFLHDSKWLYVDDLCNTVQSFLNTSDLYEYHQHGWFFAVYTNFNFE